MVRIISVGKHSFLRKFDSLDLFTKLLIITIILLAIVTPFIVNNYQIFNTRGESEAQRLRTIAQLQESQGKLQDIFAKPSIAPTSPTLLNSSGKFNLIDAIGKIFMRIAQIFK